MTEPNQNDLSARVADLANKHGLAVNDHPALMRVLNLQFSSAVTSDEWLVSKLQETSTKHAELFARPSQSSQKIDGFDADFVRYLASRNIDLAAFRKFSPGTKIDIDDEYKLQLQSKGEPSADDLEIKHLEALPHRSAVQSWRLHELKRLPSTSPTRFTSPAQRNHDELAALQAGAGTQNWKIENEREQRIVRLNRELGIKE